MSKNTVYEGYGIYGNNDDAIHVKVTLSDDEVSEFDKLFGNGLPSNAPTYTSLGLIAYLIMA